MADQGPSEHTPYLSPPSIKTQPPTIALPTPARSYECGPGCVVGSTDFYLARPHGTRAVCRSSVARVLRVTRSGGCDVGCVGMDMM